MAEEPLQCPRCNWPVNKGETACESCGQELACERPVEPFRRRGVASRGPNLVCTNCHAFWPPAATTGKCPACGHELYVAGFTAPGSWPPAPIEQPLPYIPGERLMTRNRLLDVAIGVFFGLIAVLPVIITFGLSVLFVLGIIRKAFNTFPNYRRGVYYGGSVAALVLLSLYMNIILRLLKI